MWLSHSQDLDSWSHFHSQPCRLLQACTNTRRVLPLPSGCRIVAENTLPRGTDDAPATPASHTAPGTHAATSWYSHSSFAGSHESTSARPVQPATRHRTTVHPSRRGVDAGSSTPARMSTASHVAPSAANEALMLKCRSETGPCTSSSLPGVCGANSGSGVLARATMEARSVFAGTE